MAAEINMPSWGMTMKEGKITQWLKKEGDPVEKGDDLLEVETEKITNIVGAVAGGILFQIIVPQGSTVPVKTVLGIIAEDGEVLDRVENTPHADDVNGTESKADEAPGAVKASPAAKRRAREMGLDLAKVSGSGPGNRITEKDVERHRDAPGQSLKTTPLAKAMADKEGVDLSNLTGTGDGGRITKADVEKAIAEPLPAVVNDSSRTGPAIKSIPYDGMRRAIGDNMQASLRSAAQLTCFAEVDVTEMVRFRDAVREAYKGDDAVKISFNDIIILAVSRALKHHPIMNSTHEGEEIILHDDVNMGIAVAVEAGLIVPVLRRADQKGLLEIASRSRELAGNARSNNLNPDDISGGTFTISNTGMLEVDGFTPILRPPETGILGVGRVNRKPAEHKGKIVLRDMMVLSLTYNHCVVDGVPAHSFLSRVGRYLQNPYLIMG